MEIGQARHDVEQSVGILEEFDRPMSMDGDIVPGRHDLSGFLLGLVPGRRHIGVRSHENRQAIAKRWDAPMRICLRDMAIDHALLALALGQEKRQWRR